MENWQLKKMLTIETTPMYVFDLAELRRRVCFLRQNLPENVDLCYAVKANTFILDEISKLVDRLEICSPGELGICQKRMLPAEKFVISGLYKDPLFIQNLVLQETAVGCCTVESAAQFAALYEAAEKYQRPVSVLLRLTSGNQFGLDKYVLEQIVARYKDNPWVKIRGIQYFSGTQKNSIKRLKRELGYVDQYLESLYVLHGYRAQELEFGPGLPVAYFEEETFDEEHFLHEFSALLAGMQFQGKITLELGRSIAASCGSYFTRVVDIKRNHSQNYAVVDGGMHQMVYYGQSMAMKHPHCKNLSPCPDGETDVWNICGSLCTIHDILVKQLPLVNLQVGDVLVFENTGAYCMTEGISLFLSRDLPAVVLLDPEGVPLVVRDHILTEPFNTPNYEMR